MTKHSKAIIKLRSTLLKIEDIDVTTERILPENPYFGMLGGLEYKLKSKPDYQLSVEHDKNDDFAIFLKRHGWTARAFSSKFRDLERNIRLGIKSLE